MSQDNEPAAEVKDPNAPTLRQLIGAGPSDGLFPYRNPRANSINMAFTSRPSKQYMEVLKAYQGERVIKAWAEYHAAWCGPENEEKRAGRRLYGVTPLTCQICGQAE